MKLKIELNRDDESEDDEENKIKLKTIIKDNPKQRSQKTTSPTQKRNG